MQDLFLTRGVLRTPMFSYQFYEGILDGRISLKNVLLNPIFSNALYLASPELYSHSRQLLDDQLTDYRKYNKLKNAILKYAYRASTRCTPFGLFSGLGVMSLTPAETRLTTGNAHQHRTHTRLDMDFLGRLAQMLTNQPCIRPYLTYRTNTSLYRLGDSYRYINSQYLDGLRKFELIAVQATPVLDNVFGVAGTGAFFPAIVQSIVDDEVDTEDAEEFIYELIDQHVLSSELELSTTGQEAGAQLLATLQAVSARVTNPHHQKQLAILTDQVDELVSLVNELNAVETHQVDTYQTIIDQAKWLCPDTNEKFLIQCDTVLQFDGPTNLSTGVLADVQAGLNAYKLLSSPPQPNAQMLQFIKRFTERYGDREVPMTEALDVEVGIGYGTMAETVADFGGFIDRMPLDRSAK